MKHSPRTPLRFLLASLFLGGLLGTGPLDAATWRDYAIDRKPAVYFVGNQNFNSNDCVGWSCRGALLGQPTHAKGFKVPPAPAIYARAMKLRARPGEKIDARHGAQALRQMGLIEDYEMLQNPYEIWDWLKYEGPVAAAIYWDNRMTTHRGSLRPVRIDSLTWRTQKAHAITILGWNPDERAFVFTPNLGTGWGNKGFGLLRETDFPHVFVNAVGFEHSKQLDAKSIGRVPPGDRDKMRAAAAANIWYAAPGPMKTAKLGEAPVSVGATEANAKPPVKPKAQPVAQVKAKPETVTKAGRIVIPAPDFSPLATAKTGASDAPLSMAWARNAWLKSVAKSKAATPSPKEAKPEATRFAPRKERGTVGRRR